MYAFSFSFLRVSELVEFFEKTQNTKWPEKNKILHPCSADNAKRC